MVTTKPIRLASGWYASYWNAFLFYYISFWNDITVLCDVNSDDNKFQTQLSGITSSLTFDRQPCIITCTTEGSELTLFQTLFCKFLFFDKPTRPTYLDERWQAKLHLLTQSDDHTQRLLNVCLFTQNGFRSETIELPQVFTQYTVLAWRGCSVFVSEYKTFIFLSLSRSSVCIFTFVPTVSWSIHSTSQWCRRDLRPIFRPPCKTVKCRPVVEINYSIPILFHDNM